MAKDLSHFFCGRSFAPGKLFSGIIALSASYGKKKMKTVAIVYNNRDNSKAIEYIESTLKNILGDRIEVVRSYLNELPDGKQIEANAFILMNERMLYPLKSHVADLHNVIVMGRSFSRHALPAVYKIPAGTDVLVVNDTSASTMETLYMLYELGISHLNLIPYDAALSASNIYDKFEYAITPNEPDLVPKHIKNVINIGFREIGLNTMLMLISRLGINEDAVNLNLMKHVYDIAEPNLVYSTNYIDGFVKDHVMDEMVKDTVTAVFAMNANGNISYANDEAKEILKSNELSEFYGEDVSNQLITLNGLHYLMDRKILMLENWEMGCMVVLRNEKGIRDAEIALNKKLKDNRLYAKHHFDDIVHRTSIMDDCIAIAKKAALTDYTVLLYGESGTGKELFAQSIHNYSNRRSKPFIAINCAALPESLLESELFGYENGAFTGAEKKGKPGLFEQASTGTIFLDEIAGMSMGVQSRLLRVLQEKQIMRIGSDKVIDVDVRIIAATNKDLLKEVQRGSFRNDLYYRLNVIQIDIPPLRSRKADILPLFKTFTGRNFDSITPKERQQLVDYSWPGNVRELENCAFYTNTLGRIPSHLSDNFCQDSSDGTNYDDFVSRRTLEILKENTNIGHGIGRISIINALHEQGIDVSDSAMRQILQSLSDSDLITIGRGRFGTKITEKGLETCNDIT